MTNQLLSQWVEISKQAVEPMAKLNEITVGVMEKVARQQLDIARDYMDLGAKQVNILGEASSPESLIAHQGELVSEFGDKLLKRGQEFVNLATETQQAVAEWAESAAETVSTTAQKVTVAAAE